MIIAKLKREDIAKLWSTKYIMGRDEMEILVWQHRMNHFSFKFLIRLTKSGVIIRKLSKIIKIPPCVACMFGKSQKIPRRTKVKH